MVDRQSIHRACRDGHRRRLGTLGRSTHVPRRASDLSDTQVIIRTQFPGQAPQIVEDQVTYPLATTMMSVPGAKNVRGYSFFGDSFVYVLFADGTDLYWARSRVLEYLNQVQGRLPRGASAALGPGCDRCRLDLRVRAGRPDRSARPGTAARATGLVPEIRAQIHP
jgi:hypothetical protein